MENIEVTTVQKELLNEGFFYNLLTEEIINPNEAMSLHPCSFKIDYEDIIEQKTGKGENNNYEYFLSKSFLEKHNRYINFMKGLYKNPQMRKGKSFKDFINVKTDFSNFYIERGNVKKTNTKKSSLPISNVIDVNKKEKLNPNSKIGNKVSNSSGNTFSLTVTKDGNLMIKINNAFNPEGKSSAYVTFDKYRFTISKNNFGKIREISELVKRDGNRQLAEKILKMV